MATISEEDRLFIQLVSFEVEPAKQLTLIKAITAEIERWVRKRPGFVSSTLHASNDGKQVINCAQWQDENAFKGFTQDAEGERLKAAIKAVDASLEPHAIHCHVVRRVEFVACTPDKSTESSV